MDDRTLDVLVAVTFFEWKWGFEDGDKCLMGPAIGDMVPSYWPNRPGNPEPPWGLPHYSTDIAAAWQVVEKMRQRGLYLTVGQDWPENGGQWEADFSNATGDSFDGYDDDNPARAICLAAKKMVDAEEKP